MEWQRGILRGHLHETMSSICNVSRRQQHLQDVLVVLVIGWDEQMWNGGGVRWAPKPLCMVLVMLESGALLSLVHHFGQTTQSYLGVALCHPVTVHFSLRLLVSEKFKKPIFPMLWFSPWGFTSGWKMCSKCNLICGKSLYSFIFSLC